MTYMRKYVRRLYLFFSYLLNHRYIGKIQKLGYCIMTIDETLDYISQPGNSMVRFGDGEIDIINGGGSETYQRASSELQKSLLNIVIHPKPNLLVCLPDTLISLKDKEIISQFHWTGNFKRNYGSYKNIKLDNYIYGNAFVSRPYMIYRDKSVGFNYFQRFIELFTDKDILLVEGKYSRNGVGNDLFYKAHSIKRILCPNINAYEKYDEILKEILKIDKTHLILLSLGPTAKVLVAQLVDNGYWALDIGHVDSEYEWFLKQSKQKFVLSNKHTAEQRDNEIGDCTDPDYLSSIIAEIE